MIPSLSKKGSFFLKYFLIFSAIVFASFFILGTALMVFVGNFMTNETLTTTQNNAKQLADTTSKLLTSSFIYENSDGAVMVLCKNISLMAESNKSDVYVCNAKGEVIVCADIISGFDPKNEKECAHHQNYKIPKDYIEKVKDGAILEFSTMGELYDERCSVAIEPIYAHGQYLGFCVVATPNSGTIVETLNRIFVMFLLSAAIALTIVTIVVYFMTGKIAKPIRNLETATSCYAEGDFSYRVPEIHSNDELSRLITKFNAMANSLAALEDSRRSFVANVSHEFKTPMTTIGGFINGILDGTIPQEKQAYYLNIVSSEIDRLSRMVNMMLNISKIETGNITMTSENFDICQKLVSTFLGFEQLISEKNIEIEGFDNLSPLLVSGDSAMLEQAIYNLTDNAVKFTDNGGKISVHVSYDKKYGYFSITNTGKGIPEKDIDKVFDRFYKVDRSRSTDVKSTGLGLYLVRSIINLHHGTITVESVPDEFTRFTVKLPL